MSDREHEGQLREERSRGQEATRLLENRLFVEAVDIIKQECWEDFVSSNPKMEGDEKRRIARMKLGLIDDVLKHVKKVLTTGKMAAKQLDGLEKAPKE